MITDRERILAPLQKRLQRKMAVFFQLQKRMFLSAFDKLKSQFPEIKEAGVPPGTPVEWEAIWDYVALNSVTFIAGDIDDVVREAMKLAGLVDIGSVKMSMSFTLKNPAAVSYLENYGARLVSKIDLETKDQLRTLIVKAADEGWSYGQTAAEIRDRFNGFSGLMPQQHIQDRATLVAVTETGNAYTESTLIQSKAMEQAGLEMEKSWLTVGDGKVSDGCLENQDAGWIPIDDAFPSGHQRPLRFPGCRCSLLTQMAEEQ